MSNLKRNFAAFQSDTKQTVVSSTGTKKVKPNSEPNIKVYTRFRPVANENFADTYQLHTLENSITINKPDDVIIKNGGIKKFFFSEVFDPDTTQEEIMKQTCVPLIEDLFNYNKSSLIFTYGVTNAGKTHTIIGTRTDPGILPRTIKLLLEKCNHVMESINNSGDELNLNDPLEIKIDNIMTLPNHPEYKLIDLKLSLESFEIYNEEIYDLLSETKKDKISGALIRPKLQMKEKDNRRVYIKDLTSVDLSSVSQVESILEKCISNRSQADTLLNSNSSRSHTIFRIVVKYTYQSSASKCGCESSLCIVDLAGSERAKRTENAGNQMVEACNINKSLLVLGRCLKSLKENQNNSNSNAVVPYRDSKLTRILYEYFHEENNLRMIANINPRQVDFEESMRVLNYAAIAKDIQPIKSRIDNTRRILFPLGNNKELNRSRTEDTLSALSTEDSILNLKGLFDDKENVSSNINGRDSISKKQLLPPPVDERDIKIKVLEDMVMKLQEKLYLKDFTSKLNNINENFKQSMRSFIASEKNSLSKALDSFGLEPVGYGGGKDYAFSEFQNFLGPETKPLNVNYFIFQGPIEEKGLNGLQKIFNVSNTNIHKQLYGIAPENPRNENKENECPSVTIDEKPPSQIIIDDNDVREEEDPEEGIIEITKDKMPVKPAGKNKKQGKKQVRGKKNNKKDLKTERSNSSEIAELTGFEHLDTPELIKLTVQLDEGPSQDILKKEEISSFHLEKIESEEHNNKEKDSGQATPIAKRTRARRQKK